MRPRPVTVRAVWAVLIASLLATAVIGAAGAGAAQEVLVGRYAGHVTGQGKSVDFRVAREGDKLVLASFSGALEAQCKAGRGKQSATFGGGKGTVIPADGRVDFEALGGGVKVSIVLGGPVAVGRIDYSAPDCDDSVKFTAELQPPDPILQAGRYLGTFRGETYGLTVVQKRGYFELTDFTGAAENCQDKKLGVDVSPDAFVDGEGRADFTALGGRVKVAVKFHHKSHVEGSVTYSEPGCSNTVGFAARLKAGS
jgi:hypothetical protein